LGWFVDLAKMPSRIRQLADGMETARDPRPVCRNCGKGRVTNLKVKAPTAGYSNDVWGTCEACGFVWSVYGNAGEFLAARLRAD
jgi:DNA-directed RNA polymerase subunit M/transcription elongation factor TFIIS